MKKLLFLWFLLLPILLLLVPVLLFAQDKTIVRHQFTSRVQGREPVDMLLRYTPAVGSRLYYYTELSNMQGVNVSHVWYVNNNMVYQMPVKVDGARWRTHSTMNAPHFKVGDLITVEVVGENGIVYTKDRIVVE